jgi:PAS domain S-box-containing protein
MAAVASRTEVPGLETLIRRIRTAPGGAAAGLFPWRPGALLLVFCVLFAAAGGSKPARAADGTPPGPARQETVRLQLKWKHQFQFAGYYAAVAKGYFAQEGLRVELIEGGAGFTPSQRLFTGQADYAVDTTSILRQRQAGKKVVVLAAIFQHTPTIILTRLDRKLTNPQSLAGLRIMMTASTDTECLAMLANEGLKPGDYTEVPHTESITPLVDGTVDAMTAYLTDEPYLMQQLGVAPGIISPSQYSADFYGDCLVTSEAEIRDHPQRVEAFLRAVRKGWRYAMAHQEETADLILAHYPTAKSRDELLYEATVMDRLMQPELIEIGHMNADRWRYIVRTYQRLGLLAPDFDMKGFLYPEIKRAREEKERRALSTVLWLLGGAGLTAGACAATLFVFNNRLALKVAEGALKLLKSDSSLRDSERRLRIIFESSPVGLVHFASDGAILDRNERFVAMLGAAAASPGGFKAAFQNDPALWETMRQAFAGSTATWEGSWTSQAGGEEAFLRVMLNPVSPGHDPTEVIATFEDVTERKRTQELLTQTEKMMSVGGLAAGMAHEINNPLSAIMQGVQVVQNRTSLRSPANLAAARAAGCSLEHIEEYLALRGVTAMLQAVREAGSRAAKIVASMLAFSRKAGPDMAPVDLNDLMEQTVELTLNDYDIEKNYDFRKIVVERDFDPDLEPVPCNAVQIEQVVVNLLRNAAQAMLADACATRPPKIVLRTGRDGDLVRIEVQDNGPGMDEEVSKRIFEPFFTTKEPGRGTGLGLSVSYFIVTDNHAGDITVRSRSGEGTSFCIRLPAKRYSIIRENPPRSA